MDIPGFWFEGMRLAGQRFYRAFLTSADVSEGAKLCCEINA